MYIILGRKYKINGIQTLGGFKTYWAQMWFVMILIVHGMSN